MAVAHSGEVMVVLVDTEVVAVPGTAGSAAVVAILVAVALPTTGSAFLHNCRFHATIMNNLKSGDC